MSEVTIFLIILIIELFLANLVLYFFEPKKKKIVKQPISKTKFVARSLENFKQNKKKKSKARLKVLEEYLSAK